MRRHNILMVCTKIQNFRKTSKYTGTEYGRRIWAQETCRVLKTQQTGMSVIYWKQ